jgi:hypothetical protein
MYVCSGFLISWAFWVAQLSRNSSPGSLIKRGHCVFFSCLLPHILQSLSSSCNPIPIPNTNTKLRTSTSTIKPLLYQTKIPHCNISRTIYLIPPPLLLPFVLSHTTKTYCPGLSSTTPARYSHSQALNFARLHTPHTSSSVVLLGLSVLLAPPYGVWAQPWTRTGTKTGTGL